MKALFKHLSAITQGEPGSVVNQTSSPHKNISSPFLSTTLLAVFLGVPQVPIIGGGKAIAQTTGSCPAGTAPEQVQLRPSDNLSDLTQEYNIGGIQTIFTLTEEVPGQVIDRTESRVDSGIYGGVQGPNLRLNIGPGKPPESGNFPQGSATLTITFAQSVTLASPLTLLDVDRNGERDNNRIFQDRVTVSAANNNSNVPVNLQALGSFTQVSGTTAFGINDNSRTDQSEANVSVTPGGAVDQIRILYQSGTDFGQPGQDQTIGLAPFSICAPTVQTGTIGDTVYRDTNGDGTQNPGEEGIGGINLTLTNPGPDGEFGTGDDTTQTTTTNDNGIYSFPNVPAGNYRVVVDNPPDGLTPTQTPPQTIVVAAGQNLDTVDFGFSPQQTGSIGDTVYRDNNNNNVQDDGDTGIGGVTVTLINPGADGQFGTADDTTQTTTTNDTGIYSFPNLPAGNYRVTSATPEGLSPSQTQPDTVNLQAGQNIDTVDFGFSPQQTGAIGDRVYRDNNGDGTQNPDEPGIGGVEVTLINPGPDGQFGTPDDTTQTTTTDDNGTYGFPNVPPGNYRVIVNNPPSGLTPTQTPPETIVVEAGQNFDTADFGFSPQQTGSIGDTVYTDGNSNNVQDNGEIGLSGATVTLINPGPDGEFGTGDDITQNTTTNENGNYSFPNLPAGNYRVTATSTRDGDNPTQTQPDTVSLQPGQNIDTVDFGFAPVELGTGQSTIGDTVYDDTNRNNTQDDGETGIPGATVTLTNPGDDGEFGTPDDTTQTTTTNDNGNYSFPNLPAGNYRITTTTPDGLTPTQTPADTVALADNQNLDTIDFGFAPQQQGTGSLGDTVYNDTNSNNSQDDGETGIPGVTVTLTDPGPDGQLGTPDDTTQTTTTDNNGVYGFTNLPPANYRVTTTTPEGLTPTQTQTDIINLQGGQNIDTIDFGFAGETDTQGTSTIGDTVYNDTNRNNTQDNGETGIPGVRVTLTSPGDDGQLGTGDDTTQTTTTNENGNYSFPNLDGGDYRVTITNPQNFTLTQTPPNTVTLAENQNLDTVDFGLAVGTGSIGDTVYNDTNGNGQQDAGEPGIAGVTVNIAGTGPDGVFGNSNDDDDTTNATTTDSNGRYTFPDLPAGTYRVTIDNLTQEPISRLSQTQTPNPPNNLVTLTEGQNFQDADFGFTQSTGTIGDTVYRDNNGDGTQNQGEPGIGGVEVTLTGLGPDNELGTDDDTTDTATTDDNGNYSFPDKPVGNYTVTVNTAPEDLNPTQTPPSTISLQPNQNFDTADFGFSPQQVGTIGDFVFYDNDGDSNPDLNEIGVPGITLILRDTNGNEVARTTTDDNGSYSFTVPPGTYTVSIENPPENSTPTLTQPNPINLEAGQNIDTVDFGFQTSLRGSIGDTVFADTTPNGRQDTNEPGVSGVEVTLTSPGEDGVFGTDDDPEPIRQNTDNTTDIAFNENNPQSTPGRYTFTDLPPGNYRVQIALPGGSVLTTGLNPIDVRLQPGQTFDTADFGVNMTGLPGSIGDRVFRDTNGDGDQDENEPGIPDVTVTLTLPGPDNQLNTADDTTITTTTDESGNYTFNNLPLGTYSVESATPNNFTATTGTTLPVTLTQANPNLDNVDFGFRPPGLLGQASPDGPVNLSLVKRITRINDQTFTNFEDDPNTTDDNDLNGVSPVQGISQQNEPVQSGDIIEYTIYFLKEGADELQNVRFCDQIPQGTTLDPNSVNNVTVQGQGTGSEAGQVILLSGLQNIAERVRDSQDASRYEIACNSSRADSQGAVLVNLGTLPFGIQTGFVRFRVRVN